MQFCPPPLRSSGFPNYGQPCNIPTPNQFNGYPEVIGEGNLISTICPDGSTQLLFFPTVQWPQWRSFPQNPFVGNLNNSCMNNLGCWFVRNMYNPMHYSAQPPIFPPPNQDYFSIQCPRGSTSDCCFNMSPPGLPLKFHNDTCTSTTDIHYFIPKQFDWFRKPTGCVSIQAACAVENTSTACDSEFFYKPCKCNPKLPCKCAERDTEVKKQNIQCMCVKIKKSSSHMSIESSRSRHKRRKPKSKRSKSKTSLHKCACAESSVSDKSMTTSNSLCSQCRMSLDSLPSSRSRSKKSRKSKKSHKCECKDVSVSDKGVTTYAEQGSGRAPERGRETQTCCESLPSIHVGRGPCDAMCRRAEAWAPRPCATSHAMSQSSVSYVTTCSSSGTED